MDLKSRLYYFGEKNMNFSAVKTAFGQAYDVIQIEDASLDQTALNEKAIVIAIIVDIDQIEDHEEIIAFFTKQLEWQPPMIALTNNAVASLDNTPAFTDIVKIVKITQIREQIYLLKHKIDWYHKQISLMQTQGNLQNKTFNREEVLAAALKEALINDDIYLVYHPMVNLKKNAFDSFEVLLKWNNSPLQEITQKEILNAAEKIDIIEPLTIWMIQKICAFQQHLKSHHGHYYNFSIDLSINQIMSPVFFDSLKEALQHYEVPPECFSFEISSEILEKPLFKIKHISKKIKELGIKISIDCVDETEISFTKISALPTSFLKVNTLHLNNQCELLINMAHDMGLKLIAKNVEADENQNLFLNDQIDYAQDFCLHQNFEENALFKDALKVEVPRNKE